MSRREKPLDVTPHISGLVRYLDAIVEPTVADFAAQPGSYRHAYLACVVTYHAIDRLPRPQNRRAEWRKESFAFRVVEMVAHRLKHVVSDEDRRPIKGPGIPFAQALSYGALNTYACNTVAPNDAGLDLHHLRFLLRDAVLFIRSKAVPKS